MVKTKFKLKISYSMTINFAELIKAHLKYQITSDPISFYERRINLIKSSFQYLLLSFFNYSLSMTSFYRAFLTAHVHHGFTSYVYCSRATFDSQSPHATINWSKCGPQNDQWPKLVSLGTNQLPSSKYIDLSSNYKGKSYQPMRLVKFQLYMNRTTLHTSLTYAYLFFYGLVFFGLTQHRVKRIYIYLLAFLLPNEIRFIRFFFNKCIHAPINILIFQLLNIYNNTKIIL